MGARGDRRGPGFGPLGGRRAEGDGGASLVEFAFVITPLLLLVMGSLSFGILLATRHGMSEAASEAARHAAVAYGDPVVAARQALKASGAVGNKCDDPTSGLTCTIPPPAPCDALDPAGPQCLDITLVLDRSVNPVVGRLPLLEAVLPRTITAHARVVVGGA